MKKFILAFFDKQFLKFLLVGVANTLVGSVVMFGLYNLAGCSYWISSAMNYIVGGVVSYFLNKHFTFKVTGTSATQVFRFALNIAVCYLVAYKLAKELIYVLLAGASVTMQDNVSMLVGMALYTGLNYLGQRFFAFKAPKDAEK